MVVVWAIGLACFFTAVESMPLECTNGKSSTAPVWLNNPGHPIELVSPNYPNAINSSHLSCSWEIRAEFGSKVKITVLEANMGPSCFSNKLQVYDDTPVAGESPLKFPGLSAQCGQSSFPPVTKSLISEGAVTVKFIMGENDDTRFKVLVEATEPQCPMPASQSLNTCVEGPCCQGTDCCVIHLTANDQQEISSPNYPQDSGRDLECSYKLVAPAGSQIAINFLDMDMQRDNLGTCLYDNVQLIDNKPRASSIIGGSGVKFCGQHLPNHPAPSIFASANNELVVKYVTDSSDIVRGRGFKAVVSAVNPLCSSLHYNHLYGNTHCEATCSPPARPTIPPQPTQNPIGTTDASGTTQNPSETTQNPSGSTQNTPGTTQNPSGTTQNPSGTTQNPSGTTQSPSGTTTNLSGSTASPSGTTPIPSGSTVNSSGTTASPSGSTVNPSETTVSPSGSTVNPSGTTANPSGSTVNPSESTANPSGTTANPIESTAIPTTAPTHTTCDSLKLTILVQDASTTNPIVGAQVNVSSVSLKESLLSNLDGAAVAIVTEDGSYAVSVMATGYLPHSNVVPVPVCEVEECRCPQTLKIPLTPIPTEDNQTQPETFCKDASISLVVHDLYSGDPLAGAMVTMVLEQGDITTTEAPTESPTTWSTSTSSYTTTASPFLVPDSFKAPRLPSGNISPNSASPILIPSSLKAPRLPSGKLSPNSASPILVPSSFKTPRLPSGKISPPLADSMQASSKRPFIPAFSTNFPETSTSMPVIYTSSSTIPSSVPSLQIPALMRMAEEASSIIVVQDVITDKNGALSLPINCNGRYKIKVSIEGYTTAEEYSIIECDTANCDDCKASINVTMRKESCKDVEMIVRVRDAKTQDAILNATVNVMHGDVTIVDNQATNATGTILTTIPEAGEFEIGISAEGYATKKDMKNVECDVSNCAACQPVSVIELNKLDMNQDEIDGLFCKGSILTISVFDNFTSNFIKSATVNVTEEGIILAKNIKTNINGSINLPINKNGPFEVSIDKHGYEPMDMKEVQFSCDPQNCEDCDTSVSVPLSPISCGATYLAVTVLDGATMDGIAGANVKVSLDSKQNSTESSTGITDKNGMVVSTVEAMADYKILVEKDGYDLSKSDFSVDCDIDSCSACAPSLTVTLTKIVAACNMTANVTVLNKKTGDPLSGASVSFKLTSTSDSSADQSLGSVITDATGQVAVPILYDGNVEVSVIAEGFMHQSKEMHINRNETCEDLSVFLNLEQAPTPVCNYNFTITVIDKLDNGNILPGVSVDVTFERMVDEKITTVSVAENVETNNAGQVILPMNSNGNYSVTVKKQGYTTMHGKQAVNCSQDDCSACQAGITIPITMPHCEADLPVTVRDALTDQLIPLADITVALSSSEVNGNTFVIIGQDQTEENGEAVFHLTQNGMYAINIEADGYVQQEANASLHCNPRNCAMCSASADIYLHQKFCENITMELIVKDNMENKPIVGAEVLVMIDTITGPQDVFQAIVGETGVVKVPIPSNGKYGVKISHAGYITMTEYVDVNVALGDCNIYAPFLIFPVSPVITCPGGVKVSLTWNEEPSDLDLYSFRVGQQDTTNRCLTYYCDGKDPCGCVKFDKDNHEGGLNGSETISYCCNDDASHMLYVDDFSGKGSSLAGSGARITITSNEKTVKVDMDSLADEDNSRYWLAGCLTMADGDFDFITTNRFLASKPHRSDPLHCRSLVTLKSGTTSPMGDASNATWSLQVTVHDAISNQPIEEASVFAIHDGNSSYSGFTNTDANGVAKMSVTQFGAYNIRVDHQNYSSSHSRAVVEQSRGSSADIFVGASPKLAGGNIRVILNWNEEPKNMDLYSFQVNRGNSRQNCMVYPGSKNCTGVTMNLDNKAGGLNGSETITFHPVAKKSKYTYMIYVDDYSNKGASLQQSGARITITDSSKSVDVSIPPYSNFTLTGVRYWFVGCMVRKGQTFQFVPQNRFTMEKPSDEEPNFCHKMFNGAESTEAPANSFCPDAHAKIIVKDAVTNAIISNARADLTLNEGEFFEIVASNVTTDQDGIITAPIKKNGYYSIKVTSADYLEDNSDLTVSCDDEDCDSCSPTLLVSLSPNLSNGSVRLILNWGEKPEDLDIHIFQVNQNNLESCDTYWQKTSQCAGVSLDLDNTKGGDNGAESITFSDVSENNQLIYMVYVDDFSRSPQQFIKSGARLTIMDGTEAVKEQMNTDNYEQERYWLAGCLRMVGATFEWREVDVFLHNEPKDETKNHCLAVFGVEPKTTTEKPGFWESLLG